MLAGMTKSPADARLAVHEVITEILVSLAVDDETTDTEVEGFEDDMAQVADLMLDALGFEVVSVDDEKGTRLTARLEILEDPLSEEDSPEV